MQNYTGRKLLKDIIWSFGLGGKSTVQFIMEESYKPDY